MSGNSPTPPFSKPLFLSTPFNIHAPKRKLNRVITDAYVTFPLAPAWRDGVTGIGVREYSEMPSSELPEVDPVSFPAAS